MSNYKGQETVTTSFDDRAKSTTALDEFRLAEAQQKFLQKQGFVRSEQAFLGNKTKVGSVKKQQQSAKTTSITQQQPKKSVMVEHVNNGNVRIINRSHVDGKVTNGSHVDRNVTSSNRNHVITTNQTTKKESKSSRSTYTTNLSRSNQNDLIQNKKSLNCFPTKKKSDVNVTYETIKVSAKGGEITLTLEKDDMPYVSENTKNKLTNTVYGTNQFSASENYNQTRNNHSNDYQSFQNQEDDILRRKSTGYIKESNSQKRHFSESKTKIRTSKSFCETREGRGYQKKHFNRSYDDLNQIISSSHTTDVQQNDPIGPTEDTYYTVCTHYFNPVNNDWIQNIHRKGKVRVPANKSHQETCVLWNQLYEPDREDIRVQKIIPPICGGVPNPNSGEVDVQTRDENSVDGYQQIKHSFDQNNNDNNNNSWQDAYNDSSVTQISKKRKEYLGFGLKQNESEDENDMYRPPSVTSIHSDTGLIRKLKNNHPNRQLNRKYKQIAKDHSHEIVGTC